MGEQNSLGLIEFALEVMENGVALVLHVVALLDGVVQQSLPHEGVEPIVSQIDLGKFPEGFALFKVVVVEMGQDAQHWAGDHETVEEELEV